MKKWMLALAFLCGTSQALAFNTWELNCVNDQNQSLKIIHVDRFQKLDMDQNVTAQLITDEFASEFKGVKNDHGYFLSSEAGDPVSLQVVKATNHGGRCGRCGDDWGEKYYAKLKVDTQEYNFTCHE
ncbi:hypothetical protein [Bdellovibrio sp. BCCA]|uniref:hypothetical protein n=1 Tax=Bdellovibrio sp. BCCA TaxID=3136281 RepID=UPI0030F11F20